MIARSGGIGCVVVHHHAPDEVNEVGVRFAAHREVQARSILKWKYECISLIANFRDAAIGFGMVDSAKVDDGFR